MTFSDVAEPTGRLVAPSVHPEKDAPEGGMAKELLSYGDILSPSWAVSWVLEKAFDFNPLEEAKKLTAGDWVEYAKCAEAWGSLHDFCDDLSRNIKKGNESLDGTWNGNAGDAAYVYFNELEKNVREMREGFSELKEAYEKTVLAVWNAAEACGDLLKQILDMAAVAALTALAGASTSWTVVGPIIAGGAIAAEIAAMINLWSRLTAVVSALQASINGAVGLVAGLSSSLDSKQGTFPLPGSAYNHQAV